MLDYRELCFFSTYLNINAGILILSCYHTLLFKNTFSSLQAKFTSLTTSSYSSSYCLWNPKSSTGSCSLFKLSLPKPGPQPHPFPFSLGSVPHLDVSQSTFSSSVYPLGTAQGPWELLSGRLQEHGLYSRKRARVCLSSPQDNISHMENLLWLQLLYSGCACVSSFPPALVGCSNFYGTLKEKATLQLW